jgi:hypothetical protein
MVLTVSETVGTGVVGTIVVVAGGTIRAGAALAPGSFLM